MKSSDGDLLYNDIRRNSNNKNVHQNVQVVTLAPDYLSFLVIGIDGSHAHASNPVSSLSGPLVAGRTHAQL